MATTIIGAGPIGCYLAGKLSKKGVDVNIIEDHQRVGEPLQCTGLVSGNLLDVVSVPEELIVNKIKSAKFFFGDKAVLFNGTAFVLDRIGFDRHMYENAAIGKVKSFFGEKYEKFDYKLDVIAKTNKRRIHSDFLVGADGPGSAVGRQIGLMNNVIPGLQVKAKGTFEPDTVELHFDENAPEFFSWVVPEDSTTARIGLATRKDITTKLKKFLKSKGIIKLIDKQAGLIPVGYHENFAACRVALVGDAASQVKATTGGGITTGLLSADILAKAIVNGYEQENYTKQFLEEHYVNIWKKGIGRELKKAYAIRRIMNLFSKKDYDCFYNVLSDGVFRQTLEKNVDLEMYSKFLKKSLMTPAAVKFGIGFALRHLDSAKDFISLL